MGRYATAKEDDKLKCLRCGSFNQSNFYSTKDPNRRFYGKIPYCKDCVKEMYTKYLKKHGNNINVAMFYLCRKIDIPYIHSSFVGALDNINNPNAKIYGEEAIVSAYMKNFAFSDQNGWGYTFDDSQGENEIDGMPTLSNSIKLKRAKIFSKPPDVDTEKYDVIELDMQEMIQKWGVFEEEDLAFLESEYMDWVEKLDGITDKSIEIMVKEVCKTCNELRRDREDGTDVTKKLATLQGLLKTSGLIEKQNSVNDFKNVGMPISEIEFRRPIREVDEDFKDVDSMRDIIFGMTGGLCRSLGIEHNFYTEKLDEIYGRYGIEAIEDNIRAKSNISTMSESEDIGDDDEL
jgi:hypothetical protein